MRANQTDALRVASRRFAVAPALMGLLLLVFLVGTFLEAVRDGSPGDRSVLARYLVSVLPAFPYLWALASAHAMFRRIARGDLFEPAVGRGLRQLGWALVGAGLTSAFVVPALTVVIRRRFPRPPGAGAEELVGLDAAYLMLIVLGIALLLVARLFTIAAEHRARSQALQTELDGFL